MSSDADAAAETVAIFDSIYLEDYCVIAAAGLFIYDTGFLTFDREVARFWNTKRTGASLLFFANKWITITYYVLLLGTFAIFPSDKSCAVFSVVEFAVAILQYVPGAAFSALRAFVLSRSKLLGLLVFLLSLAPVAANLVHYGYNFSGGNLVPFGCLISDTTTPTLNMRFGRFYLITFTIVSRVPLIVSDILLICITWTKLSGWNALRNTTGHSRILSLSDILFRGGIIYFAIMFGLNVLHLALSLASALQDSDSLNAGESVVTTFTAPITAVIVSRFLLELQEANRMDIRLDLDDPMRASRNPYESAGPSFISSLGGFVNPGLSGGFDDDFELQDRSRSETGEQKEGGDEPKAPISA